MGEIIDSCLSSQQKMVITNLILEQCRKYRTWEKSEIRKTLFADEYKKRHKSYDINWAIFSVFLTGTECVPGLKNRTVEYGYYPRPELFNDNVIIHISNKTVKPDTNYRREYYKFNTDLNKKPRYVYIVYDVNKESFLNKLTICLPDAHGVIFEEETLYRHIVSSLAVVS